MMMRVDEIQGLVTVIQQRRVAVTNKANIIRTNSKLNAAKASDAELSTTMNKLEKQLATLISKEDTITKLLNSARSLIFELSDGEVRIEKTEQLEIKNGSVTKST
jgi:seryl-tRNA synthetase